MPMVTPRPQPQAMLSWLPSPDPPPTTCATTPHPNRMRTSVPKNSASSSPANFGTYGLTGLASGSGRPAEGSAGRAPDSPGFAIDHSDSDECVVVRRNLRETLAVTLGTDDGPGTGPLYDYVVRFGPVGGRFARRSSDNPGTPRPSSPSCRSTWSTARSSLGTCPELSNRSNGRPLCCSWWPSIPASWGWASWPTGWGWPRPPRTGCSARCATLDS